MLNRKKAVAVALDVLAQLRKRNSNLVPTQMVYCGTSFVPPTLDGDLQGCVDEILKKPCNVCAIGAAILTKAKLFNNVPLRNVYTDYNMYSGITNNFQSKESKESLADVFSYKTIVLMECAFEKCVEFDYNNKVSASQKYGAAQFGKKFKTAKSRLRAIMQNIVDNNGEFIVESVSG